MNTANKVVPALLLLGLAVLTAPAAAQIFPFQLVIHRVILPDVHREDVIGIQPQGSKRGENLRSLIDQPGQLSAGRVLPAQAVDLDDAKRR